MNILLMEIRCLEPAKRMRSSQTNAEIIENIFLSLE